MSDDYNEPTKAEMLAALVSGNASISSSGATIQRSHRFPLYLFIQIENMSRAAEVPVSVIINQLIECGMEAVRQELPEQILEQLNNVSKKQIERLTKSAKTEAKGKTLPTESKTKARRKRV